VSPLHSTRLQLDRITYSLMSYSSADGQADTLRHIFDAVARKAALSGGRWMRMCFLCDQSIEVRNSTVASMLLSYPPAS